MNTNKDKAGSLTGIRFRVGNSETIQPVLRGKEIFLSTEHTEFHGIFPCVSVYSVDRLLDVFLLKFLILLHPSPSIIH
jgi:hypothetical protein